MKLKQQEILMTGITPIAAVQLRESNDEDWRLPVVPTICGSSDCNDTRPQLTQPADAVRGPSSVACAGAIISSGATRLWGSKATISSTT